MDMQENKKNKLTERDSSFDLARIICMLFVIMIHTPVKPFGNHEEINTVLMAVLYVSNGVFYMVSGRFNLCKTFDTADDYSLYYKKRFISIMIPYLTVSLLQTLLNMMPLQSITLAGYLKKAYQDVMSDNIFTHMWFMYPLIGYIIATPFLSKMLHAMSDTELSILFKVALIWNIVSIYLVGNLGFSFSYLGWFLSDWGIYFFLGYYFTRVIPLGNKNRLYFAGFIGFAITLIGKIRFPSNFQNWADIQIGYIFFVSSFYFFVINGIHLQNEKLKNSITGIAKYTYLVYLTHFQIMTMVSNRIIKTGNPCLNFLENTIVTVLLSLIVSVFLDSVLISPLKRSIGRLLKVNN